MTIEFFCPNGHRIRCGEDRAGKAAKCPRCGEKFRIPTLDELSATEPEPEVAGAPPQPAGSSGSGITPGIASGPGDSPDQLDFLCPNNHLLHGPVSLQGQIGKCPECGSKFRVPSVDDLEEESQEEPEEPEPTPPPPIPVGDSSISIAKPGPRQPEGGSRAGSAEPLTTLRLSDSGIAPPPESLDSLCSLFCALWSQKAKGASVEIAYGDDRLTPDKFFPAMSRGTHGLFAKAEPGGAYTLIAVAWGSITSVTIRGVKKLPDGAME